MEEKGKKDEKEEEEELRRSIRPRMSNKLEAEFWSD